MSLKLLPLDDRLTVSEIARVVNTILRGCVAFPTHLPVLPAEPEIYGEGTMVVADGTNWDPGEGAGLYVYLGGQWKLLVGKSITLLDDVGALALLDSVDTAHIDALAVTAAKLAASAVITEKIANLAVDTGKLADLAVEAAKIANLAVTGGKLANLAVTTEKIALLAVDTAQIADAAIESAKIANAAVGAAAIAAAAIGTAHIGTGVIQTAHIGDGQILTAKIGNLQVTNAKIDNLAIDNTKISALSADKINAGTLRSIHVIASTHLTRGSYLTQGCSGGASTIFVESTEDFPTSGSGWIIDSSNDRDAFSWTGKTSTTLTGCSGVLAHSTVSGNPLVIPAYKAIFINDKVNEMRFYGDNGDGSGTIEELASIGIKQIGSDYIVADFGSITMGNSRGGLRGRSYDGVAVTARAINGVAIEANSDTNYAIVCQYDYSSGSKKAPLLISPDPNITGAPSHIAKRGSLVVNASGVLYINTSSSGEGTTWTKVGAQ